MRECIHIVYIVRSGVCFGAVSSVPDVCVCGGGVCVCSSSVPDETAGTFRSNFVSLSAYNISQTVRNDCHETPSGPCSLTVSAHLMCV